MIELVHILRAVVEAACGGEDLRRCSVLPIKFSQLEQLVFGELWEKRRVALYSTAREMEKDLEKLADLGVLKYESGEIRIDPGEFLRKIEPFMLVSRNMVAGNMYLKHVIQLIEDGARRYAVENITPQPAG
ncbi:MAG: hypothetical protein ACO2PM_20115 [Pyrobaculum sp.]|jgi:hypothetical protein